MLLALGSCCEHSRPSQHLRELTPGAGQFCVSSEPQHMASLYWVILENLRIPKQLPSLTSALHKQVNWTVHDYRQVVSKPCLPHTPSHLCLCLGITSRRIKCQPFPPLWPCRCYSGKTTQSSKSWIPLGSVTSFSFCIPTGLCISITAHIILQCDHLPIY